MGMSCTAAAPAAARGARDPRPPRRALPIPGGKLYRRASAPGSSSTMTFTGTIGALCLYPPARHHRAVRPPGRAPQPADPDRRRHQRRRGVGAGNRSLQDRRPGHGRREHLRLHRRQGRRAHRAVVALRRILGLGDGPVLGHPPVHRPHLPVRGPRPDGLRADHGAGAHVLRDDQLHPGARRVADREVQGRLHGAPRAHRAVHDRRVHEPHGRRDVGDPGAVGRDGGRPDLLHLARAPDGRPGPRPAARAHDVQARASTARHRRLARAVLDVRTRDLAVTT